MRYRVTATGMSGSEYVYEVMADTKEEAIREVYAEHGKAKRRGYVPDFLTPWNTVSEV